MRSAMMLAAGRGERLAPLALKHAKPALPVLGLPLLLREADFLRRHGVERIVVNLHHQPAGIRKAVREFRPRMDGLEISFSHEKTLLGTAGGLREAARFFEGEETFILLNADCLRGFDVSAAMRDFERGGAEACLVCVPRREEQTPVWLDAEGRILSFGMERPARAARDVTFAGLHFLRRDIFRGIPSSGAPDMVTDVYAPMLAAGAPLSAHVAEEGFWEDFGTPLRFLEGSRRYAEFSGTPMPFLHPEARVHEGARLSGFVCVERGAVVEEDASLEDAVVLPGAAVGRNATLRRCIVGPEQIVEPGAFLENAAFSCGIRAPLAP